MVYLPLYFGVVLLVVSFGFYLFLRSKVQTIKPLPLPLGSDVTPETSTPSPATTTPISPWPALLSEQFLSPQKATAGLDAICAFASEQKVNKIIGVNRGGILAGAYVALKLKISDKNLLRCSAPLIDNPATCNLALEDLEGNILIIDDVCRTGKTLEKAKDKLVEKKPDINAKMVVIVSTEDVARRAESMGIEFYSYVTDRSDIRMPWHSEEANEFIINAQEQKRAYEMEQISGQPLAEIAKQLESTNIINLSTTNSG